MVYPVKNNFTTFENIDRELQFAAAVTMFALKLRQSNYINDANWSSVISVATHSADKTNYLQKEFLQILEKAQKLYPEKKKKKKM